MRVGVDVPAVRQPWSPVSVVTERSPLSTILTTPAIRVDPAASLAEAAATMERAGVSALLVGPAGGIITELDIARAIGRGSGVDELVERVATRDPIVVPASDTIIEACATILNQKVRHLVVKLDEGTGIVSLRDIAAVLLQSADPESWLASLRVATDMLPEIWLG